MGLCHLAVAGGALAKGVPELGQRPRDGYGSPAGRLTRMLQARGQYAVFEEVPGAAHTWHGARAETPYALTFASGHLAGRHPVRGLA